MLRMTANAGQTAPVTNAPANEETWPHGSSQINKKNREVMSNNIVLGVNKRAASHGFLESYDGY